MHAVNKRLLYAVIHLQQQHDILCINDARSCYDHIVHQVVTMEMQRLDMPSQLIKFMIVMLQDLEHHTRIAYGTLESSMHNYSLIPFKFIC